MSWRIKITHSRGKEGYISVISVFVCYKYLQVALELHYFPTTPKYPWAPKLSCYPKSCLHTEIPVHIHSRILYSSGHLYMNRAKNKQITYSHRINKQLLINHKMGAQTTHFFELAKFWNTITNTNKANQATEKRDWFFLYPTDNCQNSYTFPLTDYSTSASYPECVQPCKCHKKLVQKMSCNNWSNTDKW